MRLTGELFTRLPFSDVIFFSRMIENDNAEKSRNALRTGAYTAFLMGSAPGQTLESYLRNLGLLEKRAAQSKQSREAVKANARRTAERIYAMGKKAK